MKAIKEPHIPHLPFKHNFLTEPIVRQLVAARSKLAELNGIAKTIPNENILIDSLVLQESKDSSAVENIVTTHDELFRAHIDKETYIKSISTKEVLNYAKALKFGFAGIRQDGLLTNNRIIDIHAILNDGHTGFRVLPGTNLQKSNGTVVYTPSQNKMDIITSMSNLENFINDQNLSTLDPLIKMAIIHHQFESIHPFYDGNGRTGRIINILYLLAQGILDLPILYLSRFIIRHKEEYYYLLQAVREKNDWDSWVIFMLRGVEDTSENTIHLIEAIVNLMLDYKPKMRTILGKTYHHDFLNHLFSYPYTKIPFVQEAVQPSRPTATLYLEKLVAENLLHKITIGRSNYYINTALWELFINFHERKT